MPNWIGIVLLAVSFAFCGWMLVLVRREIRRLRAENAHLRDLLRRVDTYQEAEGVEPQRRPEMVERNILRTRWARQVMGVETVEKKP